MSLDRRWVIGGLLGAAVAGLAGCSTATELPSNDTVPAPGPVPVKPSGFPSAQPKPARTPPRGPLPGVGTWVGAPHVESALRYSGASWFHTWRPGLDGIKPPRGCEFVPSIRDRGDLSDAALESAKQHGDQLLTFNEPTVLSQANMSVAEALEAWPRLQALGMRLGSPADAAWADQPNSWMGRFMDGVESAGYRVDFIQLHWYLHNPALIASYSTRKAVDDLHGYLTRVHKRYGRPIWLTEFGLISYRSRPHVLDHQAQAEFLTASADMMGTLDFVERWAWFALTSWRYGPGTELISNDGRPSPAGERFRLITGES